MEDLADKYVLQMLADLMGKEVVQPNAEVVHLNDKTEVAPVIRMIE